MNKQNLLKVVNVLLAFSFLFQALTGYLQEDFRALGEAHEVNAVTLIVLALSHVALNWAWIKSTLGIGRQST